MNINLPSDNLAKPYRLGALAYIYRKEDRSILVVQLNEYSDDEWNLPGGGRMAGESSEENIVREINEELGIPRDKLSILLKSALPNKYDFPVNESNAIGLASKFRGQLKDQFLIELNDPFGIIRIDPTELKAYKWCPIGELKRYFKFPGQFDNAISTLKYFKVL